MEQVKVPVRIESVSLVGILPKQYPVSFGNYFTMGGYYVINMWYENLVHLLEKKKIKPDWELEGMAFGRGVVLTDKRIPKKYLNKKMCFTGSMGMIQERDALYRFFYPKWKDLKCFCNEDAGFISVSLNSYFVNGGNRELPYVPAAGTCDMCKREVYFDLKDGKKEVSKLRYNEQCAIVEKIMWPNK